jgi:hypothetical protein
MRVFSAFELRDGTRIWIITEADRSATTILLRQFLVPGLQQPGQSQIPGVVSFGGVSG